jgi:uncharacterized repeat protein (TIGR02543 family)
MSRGPWEARCVQGQLGSARAAITDNPGADLGERRCCDASSEPPGDSSRRGAEGGANGHRRLVRSRSGESPSNFGILLRLGLVLAAMDLAGCVLNDGLDDAVDGSRVATRRPHDSGVADWDAQSRDIGGADGGSDSGEATGEDRYALAISTSAGGSTSPEAGAHAFPPGTVVQVAASPGEGFTFTGWSGAASGAANPVTILMDSNKSLTASFSVAVSASAATYTLDLAVNGNGSTSPAAGSHAYASGSSVQVTATPAGGSIFTGWSGAATGAAKTVTIAMDSNKILTAHFAADGADLPSSCPGVCNGATPVYPTLWSGGGLGNVIASATSDSNGGACNYGATSVRYHAAINVDVRPKDGRGQWMGGKICGQCASVTVLTSQGPKTTVVRIMDKCADESCGLNVGGAAPAAIMLDGLGRYDGKWAFVSCTGHPEVSDGAPALAVANGSSAYWARVRVHNPSSAVQSIEWKDASGTASGSFPYSTNPENAFEVPVQEVLQSTIPLLLITVHYSDGTTATAELSPSQLAAPNRFYPLR